jgi:putative SOS response-associated peptidase YedK
MAALHNRMPAILPREHWQAWLDPAQPGPGHLLVPFPAEAMACHPVGPAVGNPRNEGPGLIEPAGEPPSMFDPLHPG